MFQELLDQIEAAPSAHLADIDRLVGHAHRAGRLSDTDAQALQEALRARELGGAPGQDPVPNNAQATLWPATGGLFPAMPPKPAPAGSVPRARDRAAAWRQEVARAYALVRAGAGDEEAAQLDAEYEEVLRAGPDFTRYRRGSGFMEAPRVSIDGNVAARIKFMLQAIRRGSWKLKESGKHAGAIKHSVIEVFDALVYLARKHGKIDESQADLAKVATRSRQTIVNALKALEFFGFVTVHRRIKRIRTALGFKTVQATNAYEIHEPGRIGGGWGRMAFAIYGPKSESKFWRARTSYSVRIPEESRVSSRIASLSPAYDSS